MGRPQTHAAPVGCIVPHHQETLAERVRVETEHLADVDEREGPVPAIGSHPGFGFSGQTLRVESAAPASLLDALHGVYEHGEHECSRTRRVAVPPDTYGHL
jgi:hypothetical protein